MKWIDLKDKKPTATNLAIRLIVSCSYGGITNYSRHAIWEKGYFYDPETWLFVDKVDITKDVTHWAELPKLSKEDTMPKEQIEMNETMAKIYQDFINEKKRELTLINNILKKLIKVGGKVSERKTTRKEKVAGFNKKD